MTFETRLTRRVFCGATAAAAALPAASNRPVQFALMADLHHNLMPGAHQRLEAFLAESQRRSPDFLMQVGDFCQAYQATTTAEQRAFLKTWHEFRAAKYSVLGNHEMDQCAKPEVMGHLEMPRRYYSFDVQGVHFVVLDCMNIRENGRIISYDHGNYRGRPEADINHVDPEQLEWLTGDLKATSLPVVVFTHPCINTFWVANAEVTRANVREALSTANREAGWQKVIACFSGHHHVDHLSERDGVNYVLVNSASYFWVGEKFGRLAKYHDPLFAFVSIDPAGTITIEGKQSAFEHPTPTEIHYPIADKLTASISSRTIRFKPRTQA